MHQHKQLSLKEPESTRLSRFTVFNKTVIIKNKYKNLYMVKDLA